MDEHARTTLRGLRARIRLSQWDLAEAVGVSQRHVSFVETGRARPSRALLLRWLTVLEAPLEVANDLLVATGYAPRYRSSALHELPQAREALTRILQRHEPYPAFVVDRRWDVVASNSGARRLAELVGEPRLATNLLDAWCAPDGLRRNLANVDEIAPLVLAKVRADAATEPALEPAVAALADLVAGTTDRRRPASTGTALGPTLTTRWRTPMGTLNLLSVFSTFGWPTDATLAQLRLEQLFPADEETAALLDAAWS